MSLDLSSARCSLPGCGGPAEGICINQVPFDECPNVISSDEAEGLESAPTGREPETVSTGRSGVLILEEADAFLRAHGGRVLAMVAAPDAGKTTLASAAYDLLRRRRIEGLGFAGAETIRGFEERCFDARVVSGEDEATTLRTPRAAPLAFLHLRVASLDGVVHDLLISDRSGEHFDRALDTPASFADFHEIARADAILLLVDGAKLATGHQAELARMRKLILALSQAGHLADRSVHLVVTKTDRLGGEPQRVLVEQRAGVVADELRRRGGTTRVAIHLTACRARAGTSRFGDGVGRLLEDNLPSMAERSFATTNWLPHEGSSSSLDRLMFSEKWQ